jgi:hypothetical protein
VNGGEIVKKGRSAEVGSLMQYEQELDEIQKIVQVNHPLGEAKHIGFLELSTAVQEICVDYRVHQLALRELYEASRVVLDHLNKRIDVADGQHVPVFNGIAELHDAIERAGREVCFKTFDCANGDHSDCCPAK